MLILINFTCLITSSDGGFPGGSGGKESACNAGDPGPWALILGQEDPLEKEMATYTSILAWKIPWMEEAGRLQSTGVAKIL